MTTIMMTKYRASIGFSSRRMNTEGIAPMNGPKNGMTLVTPTIRLIMSANGISQILRTMYVSTPMMNESMIRPTMNPMKVSFTMPANS